METGDSEETRKQKLDRELGELTDEIRVALPGVEVLFAFLITVPFTERFTQLDSLQQTVFFAVFLCAGAATALLITPTAYHRLRWRCNDKEQLLLLGNRVVIAGLIFLALAINGIVFVVTSLVLPDGPAYAVTATSAIFFLGLWFALPLFRQRRERKNRSSDR